mmetsp:Transcript_28019/g.39388  ORF Transcript_28019/g.39388 Transcript_28019/m.39388 type:complete len:310 (-) Transcript_28019:207-1136(-)
MANIYELCNDGHRCMHGSVCVESDVDEGAFDCDCTQTNLLDAFEGLSCEHKATVYCNDENAVSRTSFCTNGGTCKENVTPESAHIDCICTDNYKGSHCQFTVNQKVPSRAGGDALNAGYNNSKNTNDGLKTGVTVFIVVIVLSVVAAFGFFVIHKKYKNKLELSEDVTAREQVRSPELQLEADGAVLKLAVSEGSGVNSPMSNGIVTPKALDMNDGIKSPESVMESGEEKSSKERAMSPSPPATDSTNQFEIGSPPENHATGAPIFEIGSPPEAPAPETTTTTEGGASPPVAPAIENNAASEPSEPEIV